MTRSGAAGRATRNENVDGIVDEIQHAFADQHAYACVRMPPDKSPDRLEEQQFRETWRKVVRLSANKAGRDGPTGNTRQHGETEAEIRASGLAHVLLRPSYFMQNMLLVGAQIAGEGVFSLAFGDGRVGMIDTRDIAQCAAKCATSGAWDGGALELTGPESIGFEQVARLLSEQMGKPIRYEPITPQAAFDFVEGSGWGSWMAALTRDYGAAYAAGWGDFVTEHVAMVTGRAPRGFREFAAEVFLPALRECGHQS